MKNQPPFSACRVVGADFYFHQSAVIEGWLKIGSVE
jgi:hypothetical protein